MCKNTKRFLSPYLALFFILFVCLFYAKPSHAIKIGLLQGEQKLLVSVSDEAQMIDVATNKQVCVIHKMLIDRKSTRLNSSH